MVAKRKPQRPLVSGLLAVVPTRSSKANYQETSTISNWSGPDRVSNETIEN